MKVASLELHEQLARSSAGWSLSCTVVSVYITLGIVLVNPVTVKFLSLVSCRGFSLIPPGGKISTPRKFLYNTLFINFRSVITLDYAVYFFQAPDDTWGLIR